VALFTPQHGANALTEMMLMHYTGSCSDIFKAAAEECDGLPLRPTPVIPGQTHSYLQTSTQPQKKKIIVVNIQK